MQGESEGAGAAMEAVEAAAAAAAAALKAAAIGLQDSAAAAVVKAEAAAAAAAAEADSEAEAAAAATALQTFCPNLHPGKPAFSKIMCRTHIDYNVGMVIPSQFYSRHAKTLGGVHILQQHKGGKQWETRLSKDRIVRNWGKFISENRLRIGCIVIFRLVDESTITFQAFDERTGLEWTGDEADLTEVVENKKSTMNDEDYFPERQIICSAAAVKPVQARKKQKTSYYESADYHKFQPSTDLPVLTTMIKDLARLYLAAPNNEYFPAAVSKVRLIDDAKNCWLVSWFPKTRQMAGGVSKFLGYHNLRIGDILEFEQQSSNSFKVMIQRSN